MASLCALLLGFAIAVLAMAGPSWRTGEQPLLQGEAPLVVVLDMSGALLADDLPPSRLLQARAKLATLLQQRSGGQRSEEHTSELQSLMRSSYAVFCLKKKKTRK